MVPATVYHTHTCTSGHTFPTFLRWNVVWPLVSMLCAHYCPPRWPGQYHEVWLIILQLDELIQWLHVFRNSSIHIEFHSVSKYLHCACVSFKLKLLLFQLFLQSMETYQELLQSQSVPWVLFSPIHSKEEGSIHHQQLIMSMFKDSKHVVTCCICQK